MSQFKLILRDNSFFAKVGTYVIGNTLQKVAVFFLVPVYTKNLSNGEFGVLGTLLSYMLVCILLIDLGISSSTVRYYHDYYDNKKRLVTYLNSIYVLRGLSLTIFIILFWVIGPLLWPLLTKNIISYEGNYSLILGIIACEVIIQFKTAIFQASHKAIPYVIVKIVQTVFQLIAVIIFLVYFDLGITGVFMGILLGCTVVASILVTQILVEYFKNFTGFNYNDVINNLKYGLPLIPHSITIWIRNASDRMILIQFVSLSAVGIYHLGFTLGLAIGVIVNSLDLAFAPIYYRILKKNGITENSKETVRIYATIISTSLAILCFSTILFGNEIIQILGGVEYNGAEKISPLIIFSFYIHGLYTIVVKPIFYFKKTKILPVLTITPAIIGIALNLFLIPYFGITIAAWNTVIIFLLTLLVVYKYSIKLFPVKYEFRIITVSILLFIFSVLNAHYIEYPFSFSTIILKLIVIIILTISIWINYLNDYVRSFKTIITKIETSF